MNDKVSQAIVDAAEKLGFAAERVWPQIVMLTWINAMFWLILEPILIAAAVYGTVRMVRWLNNTKADCDDMGSETAGKVIIIGVCALFCFLTLLAMGNDLATVFYPEARAVLKLAGK